MSGAMGQLGQGQAWVQQKKKKKIVLNLYSFRITFITLRNFIPSLLRIFAVVVC